MNVSDYVRLVTAIKRYQSILASARLNYQRKTGKDPNTIRIRNKSSLTTIFHLLDIPPPFKHSLEINLCEYQPIAPPCSLSSTEDEAPKSILKKVRSPSPSRVKRNVKFVGV
ncbi:Hypothetical protein BRZCDTV_20 [Brazilian cedratvirus IHUMI]|uniref:Uncharacterized protein n=1 Tax=Brazilian cedratvirus IHUMI TaxID=2126980 RepID=A0A2R8FCU7_9VIRU|nr:Hypothetical protein BRZCDTV_20 [Brazilian cedratvirus IHUMI]